MKIGEMKLIFWSNGQQQRKTTSVDSSRLAALLSVCPAGGALVRGQLASGVVTTPKYSAVYGGVVARNKTVKLPVPIFSCHCGAHWAAVEE